MMKPRAALLAALACGGAAVLLVGLDLAFNVDARLEMKSPDGAWETVSESGNQRPYSIRTPACGNDFRLLVHNGLPWSSTRVVSIQPQGLGAAIAPMHQTWTLSAGETRPWEFHLNGTTPSQGNGLPSKGVTFLQVQVGTDIYLSASVCEAKA